MSRRNIAPEDVSAQLASMTGLMADVLEMVHRGTAVHGRAIAKYLEVPYPQVYYILNVLTARRFLISDWDSNIPTRKNHALTDVGRDLLSGVRASPPRQRRSARVNPDEYARRMRLSTLVAWMVRMGLVESREDLDHIMSCSDCDRLLRSTDGWDKDDRCYGYSRRHRHNDDRTTT